MNLSYYLQIAKGLHKFGYYVGSFAAYAMPNAYYRHALRSVMSSMTPTQKEECQRRCDYYNRMLPAEASAEWQRVGDYRFPFRAKKHFSTYFLEMQRCVRYFPEDLRFSFRFGDVVDEPNEPAFVKSRPIVDGPTRSVILKLDKVRHFYFVNDHRPWNAKRDIMVGRNVVRQPHRTLLMEQCFGNPLCDLGQVNTDMGRPEWVRPFMTIPEQLSYKFIACIEGNDVATNLKWVMSSNSLAVMPTPRYETWFMEGALVPNEHYVAVKADYSDLPDRLEYYLQHPHEAEEIIANAHHYVEQFRNSRLELAISLAVTQRYFQLTGQLP
jgi:hypothetical protein